MSHFMPPALLALFAPRPPPEFKPPIERNAKSQYSGIADYVNHFIPKDELPVIAEFETPQKRKERVKKEKAEAHKKVLEERAKKWNPHKNSKATKDPFKTLFVARLPYDLDENGLKHEFSRYGGVKDVKLVRDNEGKSRGYAFIEFKESRHLKEAFQRADGMRLKGRRILVDVERGRTVPTWKPRKLGGGLGSTRAGPQTKTSQREDKDSTMDEPTRFRDRDRRDRFRDRDFRDRDRRRMGDNNTKKRSVSRSRSRSHSRHRNRRDIGNRGRTDRSERDGRNDRDRNRRRDRTDRDRNEKDRNEKDRSTKYHKSERDRGDRKDRDSRGNDDKNKTKDKHYRDRRRSKSRERGKKDKERTPREKKDSNHSGGGNNSSNNNSNDNNNKESSNSSMKESEKSRDKKEGSRSSRSKRGKSKEKHHSSSSSHKK